MTDPFEVLRTPLIPVDPDPEFAATLRARTNSASVACRDRPRHEATSGTGRSSR